MARLFPYNNEDDPEASMFYQPGDLETGAADIPPGPPPGQRPSMDTGMNVDTEEMPKLYKAPVPEPPDPDTLREKFAQKIIGQLGFNPVGYDPYAEASRMEAEFNKSLQNKNSPNFVDTRSPYEMTQEELTASVAATKERNKGIPFGRSVEVGLPQFQTAAVAKQLAEKKKNAMEFLQFAFDKFDKDMGFKVIPEGGMAIQEGTGKVIRNPKTFPTPQPKAPTEMETRISAQRGNKEAQAVMNKMQEDRLAASREARSGRAEITEKEIMQPLLKTLPKMKETAETANRRIMQYQELSTMLEKGVGGLVPGLKAALAPLAEALGMDTGKMSEAQAYQLMARAGIGKMRLELVGSGQVSNYEQELMQRLSGGSIKTSRGAAKKLFDYYALESGQTIKDYNNTLDKLTTNFPEIGKAYTKVSPLTSPAASMGNGPKVGDISKGYRFKGGNPASKNSWERVQ